MPIKQPSKLKPIKLTSKNWQNTLPTWAKNVNDIGDEVTALSDATSAAITRHDKDIVDLAQAGLKATEALEANRKDIDANKQGIVDLAKGLGLAAEAVEDNRKEIDVNKAAIDANKKQLQPKPTKLMLTNW